MVELTTWQEIADYLGVSVRTAQNYERDLGLPVRRMPGPRGRVVAYPADLERWKVSRLTPCLGENGQDRTRPAQSNDTDVSAVIEAERVAIQDPRQASKKLPRRTLVGGAVGIGVLVITFVVVRHFWPQRIPVDYRIQVSTLITLDGQGQEVWRYQFPKPFLEGAYAGDLARKNRCAFADLGGNGQIDTVFAYSPVDRQSTSEALYCFSPSGKESWHFVPGRAVVTDGNGDRYSRPYFINSVQVIKNPAERQARIVVSSNHHADAPDQVAILNSAGKLTGEFWHPGHLLYMTHADLNHDGNEKLLIAGVNNSYHAATLLVFDPANVGGTPKYFTDYRFQLLGFGPGSQQEAVLFPRTCMSRHKAFNRVRELHIMGDQIYAAVVEDMVEANPATILYRLDFSLNVLAADPLPGYQEVHREMYRTGELDHELTLQEIKNWKKAVVIIK